MGVLEDAIREHLELKRKHGASEAEVERKELEALGPARREFEAPADETADDEAQPVEAASESPKPALADEEPTPPEPEVEPLEPDTEPEAERELEPGGPEANRLHESQIEATRMHEPPTERPPAADAPDFADGDDEPRRDRPLDFDFD